MFLHDSELHVHGNLKSSNCVVNSRWTLQVTDFGLLDLRTQVDYEGNEHAKYRSKLFFILRWKRRFSSVSISIRSGIY